MQTISHKECLMNPVCYHYSASILNQGGWTPKQNTEYCWEIVH